MRKQFTLCGVFVFLQAMIYAQDIPVKTLPADVFRTVKKDLSDTMPWRWKRGGLVNVNLAQGSLSNWAAGGDNFSLALASYVNYFVWHKHSDHTWDNNLDFYFGYLQTTSLGRRKNDDRFDFLSKYGYRVDTSNKLYISALLSFRTQLFDGFNYYRDSAVLSSTFLSPAYLVLSLGMDYKPFHNFSIFLSPFTTRSTIVASKRLYSKGLYGVPPYKRAIGKFGAFASINYYQTIFKNVTYKGRLDLFSDYKDQPQNVDMFFTNVFAFQINKYLSASYSLDMIYDDDVRLFGKNHISPALQVKSLIGIGFSMPFYSATH